MSVRISIRNWRPARAGNAIDKMFRLRGRVGMILDILTVLFLVSGFLLLWSMIAKRRRDVLHGPYVTKEKCTDLSED